MNGGGKRRDETELEWAERSFKQGEVARDRFHENHPGEPTSWDAVVVDRAATLELRRAGDDKTMVKTAVNAYLRERERAAYGGQTWKQKTDTAERSESGLSDEASPNLSPESVLRTAESLGRKYEVGDVSTDLYEYAVEWLAKKEQPISFEYLADLRRQMDDGKTLSVPQAKGVLNCIVADARRAKPRPAPTATGSASPTPPSPERGGPAKLEPGIYKRDDAIYKVQAALHGSNHLYAKRLVVPEGGGKGRFEYEKGAISRLQPEDRLSLADAKAFGAIYGVCCVCGALLTNEDSIEAGIGPICAGKL
jgi:hypothetical protein